MDYTNVFAGMPQQRANDSPFASRVKDLQRANMAQPFLEMAQQGNQLDLAKKRMEVGEFMGQDAQEARLLGHRATAAKHTFDAAKARADFDMLPQEQKLKAVKLGNEMASEQGKPYTQMFESLAGMADQLEKIPEEHRPMAYKQWAERFQQTSGRPLPQGMQNYSPKILEEAKMVRYGLINTPAHQQQMNVQTLQGTQAMDRQREQSRSAAAVAGMNNAGAMDRTRYTAEQGTPRTTSAAIARARRIIADPNADAEAKEAATEELRGYINKEALDYARKHPLIESLSAMAGMPGELGKTSQTRLESETRRIMDEYKRDQGFGGGSPSPRTTVSPQIAAALQAAGKQVDPNLEYKIMPDGSIASKPRAK